MSKNRSIELQLIKPVSGKSNMKGRITLNQLQKELLTDLNVPFYDNCCQDEENPYWPVRFNSVDQIFQRYDGIEWVEATSINGGGDLQAVTNNGNFTTHGIISGRQRNPAYQLITEHTSESFPLGLGFTTESGGWSSIYLGTIASGYAPNGTFDRANIYLGTFAAQSITFGGSFNMFIGYQSGIGHNALSYKFYLAQGAGNHLLHGDFLSGDLNIKRGLYIGGGTATWTDMVFSTTARLEIHASDGTVGTGPIKLNAGTNLSTPVNGMFEFNGTNLFFTVGGVRRTVTLV